MSDQPFQLLPQALLQQEVPGAFAPAPVGTPAGTLSGVPGATKVTSLTGGGRKSHAKAALSVSGNFDAGTQARNEQLAEEAGLASSLTGRQLGRSEAGIQRVGYSHDAMIDIILATPGISQREVAAKFGYTEGWVSQVFASDAFKVRLAARKETLIDPTIAMELNERLEGLGRQSLDVLQERLALDRKADVALKALDIATRALGYGARPQGTQVAVQAHFVVQVPGKAATSQDWADAHRPPAIPVDSAAVRKQLGMQVPDPVDAAAVGLAIAATFATVEG